MIENLKGIHETVNYKKDTGLRLYVNDEDATYPMHWHSPVEILCPTHQDYLAECNHNRFHLAQGDILIICPGTIHTLSPLNGGIRIIFQADSAVLYGIKQIETLFSLMAPAVHITKEGFPLVYEQIHRLLLEIRDAYLSSSPFSEAVIYAKLIEIIVLVGADYTGTQSSTDATTQKRRQYNENMLSICNYISAHCTEDLTLDQVAAEAGFSKYHFARLFKQFTDTSFYRYLNLKRIALAEEHLINPDISVTEAACLSGFSSPGSFIRMFKIIKMCTPSEFRKMHKM